MDDLDEKYSANAYGSLMGPNANYVKLISSDGHEFVIKREYALVSGTIKAMLTGPGDCADDQANDVHLHEIPSHILEKVCGYFIYKVHFKDCSSTVPPFAIEPNIAVDLLMAANFLDC